MSEESASQSTNRKTMKYKPKVPSSKGPKPAVPNREPSDATADQVMDAKLLRLVKQADQGSMRRIPKEKQVAPMQVVFGSEDTRTAQFFGSQGSGYKHPNSPVQTDIGFEDTKTSVTSSRSPGSETGNGTPGGSAPKKEKDNVEPWDYQKNYPIGLPLRRPYSGNSEILNEEEFGKASESSNYDETKINPAKEIGLMDNKEEPQMIFFQLPPSLPLGKRSATAKSTELDGKREGALEKACSLEDLPAGFMGKLLVYKSGTVKMKLGDVLFDVSPGTECVFAQDVMAINTQEKHCCVLGEPNKRAVVTADINSLLDSVVELD